MLKITFRLVLGITGICETLLGLSILLVAGHLQAYLATGVVPEPVNLRILGMMDSYIGAAYIVMALDPDKHLNLLWATCALRFGLSILFLAEGLWLLEQKGLRTTYQFLAAFDFSLFVIQGIYLRSARRWPRLKERAYAAY